jgi:chromate reductase, NAD(P)H dehydrogenase (quinone)
MNDDTPDRVRLLGVAGSLRSGSFNAALLEAAVELAPADVTIDVYRGIGRLPLYDADLDESEQGCAEAEEWRQAIAAADGLLIVTPEYNFSVPGLLKNAIDWGSRPRVGAVLLHKPVGMMGASQSLLGSARAQLALRQILWSLAMPVMAFPEVLVTDAPQRFDDELRLTDEPTRAFVAEFMVALADWTRHMAPLHAQQAAS